MSRGGIWRVGGANGRKYSYSDKEGNVHTLIVLGCVVGYLFVAGLMSGGSRTWLRNHWHHSNRTQVMRSTRCSSRHYYDNAVDCDQCDARFVEVMSLWVVCPLALLWPVAFFLVPFLMGQAIITHGQISRQKRDLSIRERAVRIAEMEKELGLAA